jgi:hypothetical protein
MEFVNSEKSKSIILYEGYKFRFHKTLKNDRSNGIKTKKIREKKAFIRQQMTKLALKEIKQFDFVKSLSFKFLPNQ